MQQAHYKLLSAQLAFNLGNWTDFFLVLITLSFAGQYNLISLVYLMILWLGPGMILSPVTGAICDTLSAKRIMLFCIVMCAVISILFFITLGSKIFFLVILLRGIIYAMLLPAEQVIISQIASDSEIIQLCSYKGFIAQASKIVSPLVCSGLLVFVMPKFIFVLSLILFLIAFLMLLKIPYIHIKMQPAPELLSDFKLALQFVRLSTQLKLMMLAFSLFIFFVFCYDMQFPLLLKQFGYHPFEFALAISFAGSGGLITSLFVNRLVKNMQNITLLASALITNGICIIFLILIHSYQIPERYYILLMLFFLCGSSISVVIIMNNIILQIDSPKAYIGKVSALQQSFLTLSTILGPIAGYIVTTYTSMQFSFLLGATATIAIGLYLIMLPISKPTVHRQVNLGELKSEYLPIDQRPSSEIQDAIPDRIAVERDQSKKL